MELKHKEDVQAIAKANQDFTAKLYPKLVKAQGSDKNLVVSPHSLSSVLAMLLAGAGNETLKQMKSGLAMPEKEDTILNGFEDVLTVLKSNDNFTLDAANRLYVQNGYDLKESFLNLTEKYFHAKAENLNFNESEKARKTINDWVEEVTRDKIKEIIPSGLLNDLTRLVLVNAIYFKGSWADKFDNASTKEGNFSVSLNETIKVQMMRKSANYVLENIDELDAKVLVLPYKGERLNMMLFLSNKPDRFEQMEEKFGDFDFASYKPKANKTKVDVIIPKFKMETSHDLVEPLTGLGLTNMFSKNNSDFSRMTDKNDLYVSSILQKAFIEVNEEGTEAAAATAAIMMTRALVRNPRFICDRPFLFAIRDELTGLVLFRGRVVRPSTD